MNRFYKRLCVWSLAGITAFSGNVMLAGASTGLHEVDMAGINLDLNVYAAAAGQEGTKEEASSKDQEKEADVEDDKKEKDFKLNLVYDRLGIAKVNNYLNIRKKPSEDAKIIGKLTKNAGCHIYKIKDGWAKIISGGITGWVSADYLITDEEAEEYAKEVATKVATVKTTTLKVRYLPSQSSKVYDLVPADEEMDVAKEKLSKSYVENFIEKYDSKEHNITEGVDLDAMMEDLDNWICIKIDNEKAYVSKDFVEISYKLDRAVKFEEEKKESTSEGGSSDGSSSSSGSSTSSVRSNMVSYAMQFLGNPYVWGGTSLTNGTDCSGFTMRIYEHFGYSIPRTSSAQSSYFTGINSSDAKAGDLFFYGSSGRVSHVAMYIGNGQVIHASTERTGIKISNAFYRSPIKVGRVISE